jgi:hypothetical protein
MHPGKIVNLLDVLRCYYRPKAEPVKVPSMGKRLQPGYVIAPQGPSDFERGLIKWFLTNSIEGPVHICTRK